MKVRTILAGVSLVAALALTACGGGSGGNTGGGNGGGGSSALSVGTDPGGNLAFQQKTLDAAANQAITVTFNNPASLQHNWVLVQPGQEDAVATAAAAKNGDAKGIPGVIAAGELLNPSGNETISVPATPAGTYTYICTVPGHYPAGMKGTLTLK